MRSILAVAAAGVLGAAVLSGLSACNRTEATEAARDHSGDAAALASGGTDDYGSGARSRGGYYGRSDYTRSGYGRTSYARNDRRGWGGQDSEDAPRAATPLYHGEPLWSENRSHSARENAEYHFERSGAELGAKNLDDYLAKAHRFVDHPPIGVLKLTRANGDRLLYDPKSNIFAVVRKDGAPRTLFKPDNGMAYWQQVKDQEASGDDGRYSSGRRSHRRGGYRSYGADEG